MITIFNRRELIITMEFKRQAEVREILSANGINYITKTTNMQNSQALGSHRGRIGDLGINPSSSYEYKVYVHRDDYDRAASLIG